MSWRSRPESILRWLVGDADVAAEVALITGFGAFGHIGSMQSDAVRPRQNRRSLTQISPY